MVLSTCSPLWLFHLELSHILIVLSNGSPYHVSWIKTPPLLIATCMPDHSMRRRNSFNAPAQYPMCILIHILALALTYDYTHVALLLPVPLCASEATARGNECFLIIVIAMTIWYILVCYLSPYVWACSHYRGECMSKTLGGILIPLAQCHLMEQIMMPGLVPPDLYIYKTLFINIMAPSDM